MQENRKLLWVAAAALFLLWPADNRLLLWRAVQGLWLLLRPFALGTLLAVLLAVPLGAVEKSLPGRLRGCRPLALGLTLLLVGGGIVLGCVGLLPQLVSTLGSMVAGLPGWWERVLAMSSRAALRLPWLEPGAQALRALDAPALGQGLLRRFAGSGGWLGNTMHAATGLAGNVADAGLGLVLACYMLLRRETLQRQLRALLAAWLPPRLAEQLWQLGALVVKTFGAFLSGQCLEALLLSGMCAAALLVCRMPYVPLISAVVGVTALVPVFGAWVGGAVGTLLVFAHSPARAGWFLVLFLCLQQIEGNLLYPRVIGSRVGLPGLWVLAAVTLGGRLGGVAGIFYSIPLGSVAYTLLGRATGRRLQKRNEAADREKDREREKPPGKEKDRPADKAAEGKPKKEKDAGKPPTP